MAVSAIKTFLSQKSFGQKIDKKAKAKLSACGVEQYVFDDKLITGWAVWIQEEASRVLGLSTPIKGNENIMKQTFFTAIQTGFGSMTGKTEGTDIRFVGGDMVVTQLSRGLAGFQTPTSAAHKHITGAKKKAISKAVKGLTPKQLDILAGSLWGHHAGVEEPGESPGKIDQRTRQGKIIKELKAKKTDFDSTPRTTGGMLKTREDLDEHRAAIGSGKGRSGERIIEDFIGKLDQRTEEDMLYHAVVSTLADHIDVLLGFDRQPMKMLDIRKGGMGAVEVVNTIPIYFALGTGKGPGKIGSQYTAAFKAWDAGKPTGLTKTIDRILDNVIIDIVDYIVRYSGENAIDIAKLGGSPSALEHIEKTAPYKLIDMMFPHATKADSRLRVNKKLKGIATEMTRGNVDPIKFSKNKKAAFKIIMAKKLPAKSAKKKKRTKATAKTTESPIALRNILNEMLPQMVASKMTSPALQFRTGRFANSARVENVNIGPKGGTHIDYTYMRDPYETFEPGGKQGSTMRDPRKIIGASIRELAIGILGKQPTTIRRN